ncbi:hypothetical protein [Sulfurimonas sp.]|uniref:hypothetical protein n=1 Tax=Sulfurimonas sp. TaxID=2022749 RepID=UPI002639900B|nr:hypothetical protein [Sulfurimonas sp.]MCW8894453.1 hypothetical protein [Sulfurimonas sp.]MCW9068151.1 hypothetical protein [Sulfurimonas sp.]
MSISSEHINIENNTKQALLKTLNNIGDDSIAATIMELSKSYSSKLITFQDIMDKIDSILYGEDGGEATLAMLQSVEDFKREFSISYLDAQKS